MEKRLTLAAAALALAVIGLLPALMIVASTFYVAGEFSLTEYRALLASSKQLAPLMGRSVLLSLSVTFLAMMVGTPLGVLLGKTDLPLRGAFTVFLTLPLLVPPYVIAVAWFAVLGSTGWIGHFLAPTTSEFLSSAFFGFYGCIGALSTAFMPVVMLLAQLCGASWFMTLRYIVAPLAKRGLIGAWIIAYIFCLRDLGITIVVYPPGFDTLPVRILTLMANGTPSLISALCVILIAVTLLPLFVAALWQKRAGRPP